MQEFRGASAWGASSGGAGRRSSSCGCCSAGAAPDTCDLASVFSREITLIPRPTPASASSITLETRELIWALGRGDGLAGGALVSLGGAAAFLPPAPGVFLR